MKKAGIFPADGPASASAVDKTALYRIGYGLYVVTTNDGTKDNGCIVNSVIQAADRPLRAVVCINKANYTYETVRKTGRLNVCPLGTDTPFEVFRNFGFQSGRNADKFAECTDPAPRSGNGLIYLPKYANGYISLRVEEEIDLSSHGMFICEVVESKVLSDAETMTYSYYQANVKPKPQPKEAKGWVCKVCGYVYEEDELPENFVCPVCKHPTDDFERA